MPQQSFHRARRGTRFIVVGWLLGCASITCGIFFATAELGLNIHDPVSLLILGVPPVLFVANAVWLGISLWKSTSEQWPPHDQRVLAFTRVGIAILTGTPIALWALAALILRSGY